MDRVLLIETSGLTAQCDPLPALLRESVDKTGMMVLKGVPATILDKENGNGRRYTKREVQRSIRRAYDAGLSEQKHLLCTADDHPEESFPAPINSSHVVIDAYTKTVGEDTVLMNDWLVFNTSKGKDLQGLVEAGASFSTSIEASASSMKTLRKSRIMTSLVVTQWGTLPLVHSHLRNNLGLLSNH
jgi:hypothetical protein